MSQCPYGTQVEDGFYPVWQELGQNIKFELNFIGAESNGEFQSLHGAAEVAGDMVQLCVQKYAPDKLLDFVVCQNKNARDLVSSIDSCAKDAGIDAAEIKSCSEGDEGKDLLSTSFEKSAKAGAQGSPTMYFNDKLYNGGRDETAFKRAVCAGLKDHPLCAAIPVCSADADCSAEQGKIGICANPGKKDAKCSYEDDALVKLTVLTSADCATCDPTPLIAALRNAFINMDVSVVDSSSKEGEALAKKYSLVKAPSFVFENLENAYMWKNNPNVPPAFKQAGTAYVLRDEVTGAKYVLDETVRAEMEAKIGVVKGDNKPQIDFYVMAYCPYGNMAEEAIEPVYQLLKDKAEFNPHYVIYSNYNGGGSNYCLDSESKYCSMHGIQELNHGVREICVHKYFGDDAYFKFVLAMNAQCSASNADSCWEAVGKSLKLDTDKIKACEKDEALALLAEESDLNTILGVQGSPTVFIEGADYNNARDAKGFGTALCAGFDTAPAECGEVSNLAGSSPTSAATAGAGCGS
jgi:2-hydroxychromene-2-carboxylate isomerase